LDDDVLAGFEHFGNELRAARGAGTASLITTILPWASGAAFETRSTAGASAAIGTSTAAVRTATSAIRAAATAVASAVAPAAAEWPLEAGTRIAADARGVTREIFKRSRRAANSGRARFTGEENHVFFDGRSAFGDGFAGGCRDHLRFSLFVLGVIGIGVCLLAVFVLDMFKLAVCGVVFGVFLRHVGGKFRAVGRASSFDFLDFFLGEFRNFGNYRGFRFFRLFFRLFFRFFFVEFGAADDGIGFRFFRCLFVLCLDETGGESGDLIFVQFGVIPDGFHAVASRFL
jgi:hypothetical protein